MDALLFADELDPALVLGIAVAMLVVIMCLLICVMATKYDKRCPSNRILVIFGKTGPEQGFQCVHGGARFVIPLLQEYRWLNLDAMRVEITGPAATDELAESLFLPNVFNIAIGTEPDLMQHAAKHLLDRAPEEIRQMAEDAIASHLDRTLAEQRKGPPGDGPAVVESLNEAVESDLNQLGLTLLNSRRV